MKIFKLLALILFFSFNLVSAQDTLYIYRAGIVVTKRAVSDIDSISFYKNQNIPVPESVSDIDGNVYHTVKIGNLTWMVEDLKTTKYSNGDLIGTTIPIGKDLTYEDSPKYQWAYDGNNGNALKYGRLYTWYAAADPRKIAPKGWHVATDTEWITLQNYLIANGFNYDGTNTDNKIAKSLSSTSLWNTCLIEGAIGADLTKNNSSGFSAVPAGYRGVDGTFYILNWVSDHWTSTEDSSDFAWMHALGYTSPDLGYYSKNKKYGMSVRCVKDTLLLPVLVTTIVSDISNVSALSGGQVISEGGSTVTSRGICWSTAVEPTILNSKTTEKTDSLIFTSRLTGLTGDSIYYVRAYATNSFGTAYGEQVSFKTLKPDTQTIIDRDGNVYHSIKIGNQTWMLENLKTTKYNDGESVPFITDSYNWTSTLNGGYCWYNNDQTNKNIYGALYNWLAVNTGKLAPLGWHVPSPAEINILTNYQGGNSVAGSKLKESGNVHWVTGNSDATNISGFTALPGGYRSCETGDYHNSGMWGVFWSSNDTLANGGRFMMTNDTPVFDNRSDRKNCGFSVRCIKDTATIPVIVTLPVTEITFTSAVCGGKIISNGGAVVTTRGICWSKTTQPTLINYRTIESGDSTAFTSSIRDLDIDSTYYVRAYATNSVGTAYGEQVSFKTLKPDSQTIIDRDGNVYHSIKIGNQTWMLENLKTTKYNDGESVPFITDSYNWTSTLNGGYCWYNNDQTNKNIYGALYNWFAVNTGKLAPLGWHVPSPAEINILTNYLGGNTVTGSKLKESGNGHWVTGNSDATNISGFTALPGGYRSCETGDYHNSGMWGVFWSSNDTLANGGRFMMTNDTPVFDNRSDRKNCGFSVRCIKDTATIPVIVTLPVTEITFTSAVCGGKIISNGGAVVTTRGICWSKTTQPTLLNYRTIESGDSTAFTSSLKNLDIDSTYYVRAYATNNVGTAYGDQVSFKTLNLDTLTLTDVDGNVYSTVKIGTQTWMAENLKTSRLNDSTSIPMVADPATWASLTTPAYCWYNNDSITYNSTFGKMYNWYTVETGKLAPKGWHVATDNEWETLTSFLGVDVAGGKLKETGLLHWLAPNTGATNETNFTALPGGNRGQDKGTFGEQGTGSFWWTSTILDDTYSRFRSVGYISSGVGKSGSGKDNGLYVRCVKN